jgi:hypothetical protein
MVTVVTVVTMVTMATMVTVVTVVSGDVGDSGGSGVSSGFFKQKKHGYLQFRCPPLHNIASVVLFQIEQIARISRR